MVLNYLWNRFPKAMATKDQNSQLLWQEMKDSEFERFLKVAKRFYGFRAYGSCAIAALGFIGSFFSLFISVSPFPLIFFMICSVVGVLLSLETCGSYFYPNGLHDYESGRRKHLCELYKKMSQKQDE